MDIEADVNLLLSHFEDSYLFPRKMMTKHKNYQFTVYDKQDLIQKCIDSDFTDCRVNGYPILYKQELVSYPPNFIFIDLDLSNFVKYKNPKKMLDKTLRNVLNKISASFSIERSQHTQRSPTGNEHDIQQSNLEFSAEVKPTVLWSGNGYHIYLPIQGLMLDDYEPFSKEKYPSLFSEYNGKYIGYSVSELFLLFVEEYLTSGKADPQHRPRYKSCLIRIPNTLNSKCLDKGLGPEKSKVKIIQEWNGYRPPIQLLTKEFRRWLVQEEINQRFQNTRKQNTFTNGYKYFNKSQIGWIEKLLQIPLEDYRKFCLWRILCPYFVNVKKVSKEETSIVLEAWLWGCSNLRRTDFNHRLLIKNNLRYVRSFVPPSNKMIKDKYPDLYAILNAKGIFT
jgi:Primase X